jgi:hypothetical protein
MAYIFLFVMIITSFLGDQIKEDPMDRASSMCRCGDIYINNCYRKTWVEETACKI